MRERLVKLARPVVDVAKSIFQIHRIRLGHIHILQLGCLDLLMDFIINRAAVDFRQQHERLPDGESQIDASDQFFARGDGLAMFDFNKRQAK